MFGADSLVWRRVSPFETYLRYGRRDAETSAVGPWSVKFNQWHDPRDGRFTFGPGGAAMGKRPHSSLNDGDGLGGGGGFDGGGAGGSWEPNPPQTRRSAAAFGQAVHQSDPSYDFARTIERNGYRFTVDVDGRTREVTGRLTLGQPGARSRTEQSRAGVPDRLTTDDGGHYIAARFNGPRDAFNHFAQDRNFNRGGYRALENKWAHEIRKGRTVKVDIVPMYLGLSKRPLRLDVKWQIGRTKHFRIFANRPKGS